MQEANQRISTHKPDTEYASHRRVTYRLPRISVPAQHRNSRCDKPPQRSLIYLVKEIAKRELSIEIGDVSDVDELRAMISGARRGLEDSECAICLVQKQCSASRGYSRGVCQEPMANALGKGPFSGLHTTPCDHQFHSKCIMESIRLGNEQCPLCIIPSRLRSHNSIHKSSSSHYSAGRARMMFSPTPTRNETRSSPAPRIQQARSTSSNQQSRAQTQAARAQTQAVNQQARAQIQAARAQTQAANQQARAQTQAARVQIQAARALARLTARAVAQVAQAQTALSQINITSIRTTSSSGTRNCNGCTDCPGA